MSIYEALDVELKYRDKVLTIPKLKTSDISGVRKAIGVSGIIGSDF